MTRDASGTITNLIFNETVLYYYLDHTGFQFTGTYLLVTCSSCDSNYGRIQIYNYNLPLPYDNTTTTTKKPKVVIPTNNMTLLFE
jgi:hypothetical protein